MDMTHIKQIMITAKSDDDKIGTFPNAETTYNASINCCYHLTEYFVIISKYIQKAVFNNDFKIEISIYKEPQFFNDMSDKNKNIIRKFLEYKGYEVIWSDVVLVIKWSNSTLFNNTK